MKKMNRKCIKVVKTNNYKGLCIRHTFVLPQSLKLSFCSGFVKPRIKHFVALHLTIN